MNPMNKRIKKRLKESIHGKQIMLTFKNVRTFYKNTLENYNTIQFINSIKNEIWNH